MKVLETASTFDLPDERVAVCGDWHGDAGWLRVVANAISRIAPDVSTILQAGDWWMDLPRSDKIMRASGIERVLVTLGNHEAWPEITKMQDAHPGEAVRVSESTWILPRPCRFAIAGRSFLSLGGATSVDRYWRPASDWHAAETITDEHVRAARHGGEADVMISHETPAGTPVKVVRRILRSNPHGFPQASLVESAASRVRLAQVWNSVRPKLLLHGHMHAPGAGQVEDGRRVISLGCNGQEGSIAILSVADLSAEMPSLHEIRN
ncbi:metallophosphoesterase [Microbacterium marinum]|uniref:metallophosphoesterase family protein n=1 Tax=Microbacterium marinum TaxID=421115 RepID=UPI00384E9327